MEVYLIRHTTPNIEKGICYGQSDVPLAPSFFNEAQVLLKKLPKSFDTVYSSPSTRCLQLAHKIKIKIKIKTKQLLIDKRLMEMNFGDWEMKEWDDIDQAILNAWMKDFVNVRVPHGENFVDLNNRVTNFIDALLKKNYKKVAIVTHGGVIRCFTAKALHMPLKDAFNIAVNYASVSKLCFDPNNNTKVEYANKTC